MESTAPHHGSLVSLTETQRAQALAHFHLIRPFLDDGVPLTHIATFHRLSVRTLRRWVQQYRAHGLAGLSKAQVAREFGVSRETLYQYLKGGKETMKA